MIRSLHVHFVTGLFALSLPLAADTTIISTDGQGNVGYGILGGVYAQESGWSQTGSFTDITISAEIDPGGNGTTPNSVSGTAYLMTQIGPGTTTLEQLGTASFSATGLSFSPTLDTLFTGLTLGPGNYYLVLTSDGGGWEVATDGITPVTAGGVALISREAGTPAAYPPATDFSLSGGNDLEFTVTGTGAAVPEPGYTAILLVGLAALIFVARRKSATAA
jgi:hypothetical protein